MTCNDLIHANCTHRGWQEIPVTAAMYPTLNAARSAATYASKTLDLDVLSLKFFSPGPLVTLLDIDADKELVVLNGGFFDSTMIGRYLIDRDRSPLPLVWVRAGLSPVLTSVVVFHEARHIWQHLVAVDRVWTDEEAELDAHTFAWQKAIALFSRTAVCRAVAESQETDESPARRGRRGRKRSQQVTEESVGCDEQFNVPMQERA